MGLDSSSLQAGNKRTRPEDEVYLDNFHVQKRYLSEVMASSLNGLKVGDVPSGSSRMVSQTSEPMDSLALTETGGFSRSLSSYPSNGDELSTLDSYMSDDSDDSFCYRTGRCCETPPRTLSSLCDSSRAGATPPKSFKGMACNAGGFPMPSVPLPCAQPKQRVPDAESRFPPSPSDPCYAADLRRAALLRSLQLRAQSPVAISDAAAADDCSDACEHSLAEAEDQCSPSPCSPGFDELSAEQTACNHDILGSPVHGTYAGQAGRGSVGLARSLLLDGCADIMPGGNSNEGIPACFEGVVSAGSSLMPQASSVQSMGTNIECSFSSLYEEDVSDSTEKTDDTAGIKWSSPRGNQLCNYFYKGKLPRNVTDDE